MMDNDELLAIKQTIETTRERLRDYENEIRDERKGYINRIREQKEQCGDECLKQLQEHLQICDGGYDKDHENYGKPYYKCEMRSVCYHCKNYNREKNGRCSHFYEIEYLDERLENLQYYSEDLKERIIDLEVEYEMKLAIKEGRYEQYKEDLYDDY